MRRFVVERWGLDSIPTVVWCRGIVCNMCQLRFQCFTMSPDDDFIIETREMLRQMVFQGTFLPIHIEGYHVDKEGNILAKMGMHIETVIDYLIAGEAGQRVLGTSDTLIGTRWNQGWVYQAGMQCCYRKAPHRLGKLDSCQHHFCHREKTCKQGMVKDFQYNGEHVGKMQGGELIEEAQLSLIVTGCR